MSEYTAAPCDALISNAIGKSAEGHQFLVYCPFINKSLDSSWRRTGTSSRRSMRTADRLGGKYPLSALRLGALLGELNCDVQFYRVGPPRTDFNRDVLIRQVFKSQRQHHLSFG